MGKEDTMSGFKKFTDVCGFFAAFSATVFSFTQYMAYRPPEEVESTKEKLKLFLSPHETGKDYRSYLLLVLLLLFALCVSALLKKRPALAFPITVIPFLQAFAMMVNRTIYDRPMLYLLLCGLFFLGPLYECIRSDREARTRSAATAIHLLFLEMALLLLYLYRRATALVGTVSEELSPLDQRIYGSILEDTDLSVLYQLAIIYLLAALVCVLLRDLYFLQTIVSLVPAGCIIVLFETEALPFCEKTILLGALLCLLCRVVVTFTCPPKMASTTK